MFSFPLCLPLTLVGVVDRVDILAGVYIVSEGTNLALTRLLTRAECLLICDTLLSVLFVLWSLSILSWGGSLWVFLWTFA